MESEFVTWLGTPAGIAVMVLAGLVALFAILWFKSFKTAVRKWESDFGGKLNDLGFPSWFTAAFTAASQGNLAEAFGDAQKAIKLSETPSGQAEILKGLLLKAKADPSRWAIVNTIIADVNGGIDPTADITAGINAGPWGKLTPPPTPVGILKSDMQSIVQHIQSAVQQATDTGNNVLSQINANLTAAGHAAAIPLVAAGAQAHAAATAAAAAVQAATAPAVAAVAPVVAAAVPAIAPAALAAGAAALGVLTTTVSVPPGQTATVTNTAPA